MARRSASSDDRRATLLILDGARPDVFQHLARAGDLPHLSRHVLEPGAMPAATTVFPSTTGVAYLPFLTGCYPGTCNVPGIRWMDVARYGGRWIRDRAHVRSYCGVQGGRLNEDLPREITTLFDLEPDTLALCTPFTRGLWPGGEGMALARAILGAQAHYTGRYELLDAAVAHALAQAARLARRLVFAVFPGVDGITHWLDPWHPRVLDAYRQFDRAFGRYVRAGGLSGHHLVVVVSDHGASAIRRHSDVSLALEGRGLPVLRHPLLWRRRPKVAVMVSGNAAAHVYLLPGQPRQRRYSLAEIEAGAVPGVPADLVDFLAQLEGIALVAATDGQDVVVRGRQGRARLRPGAHGSIHYLPEDGDVLNLAPRAQVGSPSEWLRASVGGAYPDAAVQLLQLFRSPRAGDLIVAAAPGADLRGDWEIPEHRSGHGSLVAEHMRCIVAANCPLPEAIRTVDVFPLIATHLGYAINPGIDGRLPVRTAAPAAAGAISRGTR
jgi:hypothetical protein